MHLLHQVWSGIQVILTLLFMALIFWLPFRKLKSFLRKVKIKSRRALVHSTESLHNTTKIFAAELSSIPEHAKEAIIALENGDLPKFIKERVERERNGKLPWTSDASVGDWLLMRGLQLEPLGLVMGYAHHVITSSIKTEVENIIVVSQHDHGNIAYYDHDKIGGLEVHSSDIRNCCKTALTRLQQEAALLGAQAVVNIKLVPKISGVRANIAFEAVGTAVRLKGHVGRKKPLLCGTSMSDFIKLLQAGTMPLGIAIGVGVSYKQGGWNPSILAQSFLDWRSIDNITAYGEAVVAAGGLAKQQMRQQARDCGGASVIADMINLNITKFENEISDSNMTIDYVAKIIYLGTILAPREPTNSNQFRTVLDLSK